MKKISSILLLFVLFNLYQMIDTENGFSVSQPLLVTSNYKIESLQTKILLNTEELINELTVEKIFTNIDKAAALPYFQDNLAINNFAKVANQYKEYTHSLSELPFNKSHSQSLTSQSTTVEKIIATFNDLQEIDKLLKSDVALLQSQNQNYYIFINFKYEPFSSNFALKELITEEQRAKYKFVDAAQQYEYSRQLEDDEHGNSNNRQIESLVETMADSTDSEAIGIPGYVFSGYLLGLLGIATTLIAVVALYEIKTPTKFARQNLNFGKEY